nr:ABC transporter permease [uncultured Marinifilum sp.]
MLKILFNTVLRGIYKQKAYSAINILGLATGVTCTLLILIWVEYELGFDKYHKDIDQIYSVYENQKYADGDIFSVYSTPSPLAKSIKHNFDQIEYSTRMVSSWGQLALTANGNSYVEKGGKLVDSDFFKIFTFSILKGDSINVLSNNKSIVLTEKLAKKYFGDIDPIGLTVEINSQYSFQVSAVIKNLPSNSSIEFDFILPVEFFEELWDYDLSDWNANSFNTFIKVKKGTDTNALEKQLKNHVRLRLPETNVDLALQEFSRYHLYSISKNRAGPIWYVQVFLLVAVLILLIACFNYMNLATARSERRAKEIAMRKVVGAQRGGLIGLIIGESIVFTTISLGVAIVFVELLLPTFSELTKRTLTLNFGNYNFVLVVMAIVGVTGFVSGSYPAFFLSSFSPLQVIKGISRKDSAMLRKILVLIQFTMSVALFICTCIVYKQLNFLQKSDVGFNKDNIIYVEMVDDFYEYYPELKNELLKIPGVQWVTAANQMPINFSNSTWDVDWEGKSEDSGEILFQLSFVDFDFIETFEMDVIQGRGFSNKFGEDSLKFIINESAASKMNMVYTIGEEINLWGYSGEVIGIVKDFNFNSLQVGVDPLIMMRRPDVFKYIGIRIGDDKQLILNEIRKKWLDKVPDLPFNYRFLEEDFDYFYQAESRMGKLFASFTIVAFIISCLGLFGLVSFVTERKSKEMVLRKVFGANLEDVYQLLLKEFFKWIMMANAIAWVLSFFVMEWWLKGFAYRIDIGIGIFILSGLLSLLIAFLTIFKQISNLTFKAPSDILKYE